MRVLIVDDDREMRASLVDLLEAAGWEAVALARAADVARNLSEGVFDVILSDVRMPGMTGLELLESLTGQDAPPVVLISAHGDIAMAVAAMEAGAYSFVEKPYAPDRLLRILDHAGKQYQMQAENARLRQRLLSLSGLDRILLGQTEAMVALRRDVVDLASSPAAALILGETGTGKELVARALHDLGPNASAPFVAVNAAVLGAEGLESAVQEAAGGTLFLDEICACPPEAQAMLLRVVERGGDGPRIVSASNEDPEAAVAVGRMRADLLFRLNTLSLTLPPLRARRDDIALLALHFMETIAPLYEAEVPDLPAPDLAALLAHDWPGNVRELRSVAERRVLAARRGQGTMAEAIHPAHSPSEVKSTLREAVAAFEREMIGKAIQSQEGRMDAVADALGIGRRTLNEKIVKLGLDKDSLI